MYVPFKLGSCRDIAQIRDAKIVVIFQKTGGAGVVHDDKKDATLSLAKKFNLSELLTVALQSSTAS